ADSADSADSARPTSVASNADSVGPLTRKVLDYERTIKKLVETVKSPLDWAPLEEFVAVEEFERVGTFLEVQDWRQYTEMLTGWASVTDSFDTTLRRVAELGSRVYFEIVERHFRGESASVVNSMTVFEFDENGKIRHLDVYLQQPR
ncbi:MAG TPA: hypothetical protein VEJ87_00255, partial [Acidimicrobiales bacterium]|nr:hypothetical protein [Acidimicrobiales bacterium]